ncbi:MAG: alkaline phosphatase family protein [Candidatus Amulumruptor caecigallinarius]|nr:alkaline phosphatase family protein [Candidatus Amulumruptor caecigallinarius]
MKRLISSVLLGAVALGGVAQSIPAKPRLVVGIIVDQLRTDYIELLQDYFGERGFQTLLRDGAYLRDVDFRASGLDAANATALLYTGAYPSETGVPSASIYDRNTPGITMRPPLATPAAGGSISNDSFTPESLRLSTISDEIAIDSKGNSAIYAIALDPQQAVIMAGHAGKGAYWINNTSGNWATSSYYGALPATLNNRNFRTPLSQRIDTMTWKATAVARGIEGGNAGFKHTFSRSDRDVYKKFAASALANAEITDVAIELLNSLNPGVSANRTDMLNIAYTLAPFKYAADGAGRTELVDSYLRLDSQLARLFNAIDNSVGIDNTLIWLSGTGYYDDAVLEDKKYRIPGGEFSVKKAKSLLNSFLSAKYGSAEYVGAIRDGQVYLDRGTIEGKRLPADEVISEARTFLIKMSGVADAYTISDILSPSSPDEESLRLSVDPKICGDIFVRYAPGWSVVEDDRYPPVTKPVRESMIATPALIRGAGIAKSVVSTPVEATAIAPMVTGRLRIRSPNGSRSRPIELPGQRKQ